MGINVLRPAYVQYSHASLVEAERFLTDFGLSVCGRTDTTLYLRGVGAEEFCYVAHEGAPGFVAGGFEVADIETVVQASRSIERALPVRPLPGPQGGYYIELRDPDGFRLDLVAGRTAFEALTETSATVFNYGERKQRFGQFQRFEKRPARIRRLAHFGFNVGNFERTFAWYRDDLGMVASDTLHAEPDDHDIAAFMRVARGSEWVDHHRHLLPQISDYPCPSLFV